jgi:predicted cupin superfamily sugar epimerase
MTQEIENTVRELDLLPHPEGGFYRETYRSEQTVQSGKRNLMTAIYFLLTSENVSRFHRIQSDELWFHHAGSPLIVHTLDAAGHHEYIVGSDFAKGYLPQFLVPKHTIFGSSVLEKDSYALVSCVVAPGFDFADFELFPQAELLQMFPAEAEIIRKMSV